MVTALLRRSEHFLKELRVAVEHAYPGIGAAQREMDDLAEICVSIRYN